MPFIRLNDLEQIEPVSGYTGHFVHSENMTFAHWTVDEGSPFPEHSHPHEQISIVIEDQFELTIEAATCILRPGVVALIPPNAVHSGIALTKCRIIDAFYPIREDYR